MWGFFSMQIDTTAGVYQVTKGRLDQGNGDKEEESICQVEELKS